MEKFNYYYVVASICYEDKEGKEHTVPFNNVIALPTDRIFNKESFSKFHLELPLMLKKELPDLEKPIATIILSLSKLGTFTKDEWLASNGDDSSPEEMK